MISRHGGHDEGDERPDDFEMPSPPMHLARPVPLVATVVCFVLALVGMAIHSRTPHGWREPTWGSALSGVCVLLIVFVIPRLSRPRPDDTTQGPTP